MPQNDSPIPPLPSKVTIPVFSVKTKQTGTRDVSASNAFFYAGIQSIWLWWLADLKLLTESREPYGVAPYDFGKNKGAVNINFFNASSFYGMGQQGNPGIGGFNETALNIVRYATKVGRNVPQGISLASYLASGAQTKMTKRVVAFGRQQYLETKRS